MSDSKPWDSVVSETVARFRCHLRDDQDRGADEDYAAQSVHQASSPVGAGASSPVNFVGAGLAWPRISST